MTQNSATFLSPYDYDHRDFVANNVLKNLDKLKPPKSMKRNITETYEQGKLGSCTAMATTHSMKNTEWGGVPKKDWFKLAILAR